MFLLAYMKSFQFLIGIYSISASRKFHSRNADYICWRCLSLVLNYLLGASAVFPLLYHTQLREFALVFPITVSLGPRTSSIYISLSTYLFATNFINVTDKLRARTASASEHSGNTCRS